MPKVANYLANDLKLKSVAIIYINNDFGKGGRDVIIKELKARNDEVAADISTDPGPVEFSSVVLKAKQANAQALFAYLTRLVDGCVLSPARRRRSRELSSRGERELRPIVDPLRSGVSLLITQQTVG